MLYFIVIHLKPLSILAPRSLVELGNESVEDDRIDDLISNMFSTGGLSKKEELSLDDFQMLLRDYSDHIQHTNIAFNLGEGR